MPSRPLPPLPQVGQVQQILYSPNRGEPRQRANEALLSVGRGVEGHHHSKSRPGGKRQVTLIQAEHLPVIAQLAGLTSVDAAELGRNLVVSGFPLGALPKGARIGLGAEVVLEITGPCEPCDKIETRLGTGGQAAMEGMGGLTARVLQGGRLSVNDSVRFLGGETEAD